mmetsp:Transcript_32053/g.46195  ORF Transcript_32053/g.46195 Transcript_32053/m.46195 type:complete len:528 (-) Transcript_32053:113-1696(-)
MSSSDPLLMPSKAASYQQPNPKSKESFASIVIRYIKNGLLIIIVAPVAIVFFILFILLWLVLTITYIGPCIHKYFNRKDSEILARGTILKSNPELVVIRIPSHVNKASNGLAYDVVARWIKRKDTGIEQPPIIFPNGLAATQIFLARPQELLRDAGFSSLTFDRLGCGFSDANISNIPPSAVDICREMDYVMNFILEREGLPSSTKWIGVGGSMGNTVLQAYMTLYPDKFLGLLNLDGFPYPYLSESKSFIDTFAKQYEFFGKILWTGVFRFFNSLAVSTWKKNAESEGFPVHVIIAQMNQPSFFGNTVQEFRTMMSCCELAHVGWGLHSLLKMDPEMKDILIRTPPTESVVVDRRVGLLRMVTMERSASERGDDWASEEEVQRAKQWMLALSTPLAGFVAGSNPEVTKIYSDRDSFAVPGSWGAGGVSELDTIYSLFPQWQKLVVRNMSCRCYGLAGSMAIKPTMMDMSAAEHNQFALLAANGTRTVYPRLEHADGFAQSEEIVRFVKEIAEVLQFSDGTQQKVLQ